MQNTTNFNLNKPEGTDIYNIQNENDNMDIIDAALAKAHSTDDAASTDLVDGDYIPFYDTSATTKKKALWSTILTKLKNIFPLGSTLAPIANGPKYPGTWSAGKQFVYQGQLCKTKVNVSTSDDISVGVSGNAELASDVTSQISNLSTTLDAKIDAKVPLVTIDVNNNGDSVTISDLLRELSLLVTDYAGLSKPYACMFTGVFKINNVVQDSYFAQVNVRPTKSVYLISYGNNLYYMVYIPGTSRNIYQVSKTAM